MLYLVCNEQLGQYSYASNYDTLGTPVALVHVLMCLKSHVMEYKERQSLHMEEVGGWMGQPNTGPFTEETRVLMCNQ